MPVSEISRVDQTVSGVISLVVAAIVVLAIGLFIIVKKPARFIAGISGLSFFGNLAFKLGVYVKAQDLANLYVEEEDLHGVFRNQGFQYVIPILIAILAAGFIGLLLGGFARGPYQRAFIGLGVGTSIANILGSFPIGLLVSVILHVILGVCFGFVLVRFPEKLVLCINWIGSVLMASALFFVISLFFLVPTKPTLTVMIIFYFSYLAGILCTFGLVCFHERNRSVTENSTIPAS